jgi:hypothetical protein
MAFRSIRSLFSFLRPEPLSDPLGADAVPQLDAGDLLQQPATQSFHVLFSGRWFRWKVTTSAGRAAER